MSKFANSRKRNFLEMLPDSSIESTDSKIAALCKFNFAFFQKGTAGQDFSEWGERKLNELLEKMVHFSNNSLSYWRQQQSGRIFTIYGDFPKKSNFKHPKNVPIEAQWARFRLESTIRLVGFVVPGELDNKIHDRTKCRFDCNTFYVVFLDANHEFYLSETA